jgi:hypothetical protein
MSAEKSNANIKIYKGNSQEGFFPNDFSGDSSRVKMTDTNQTTYLAIRYNQSLTPGTHTFNYTQFNVEYLDPAGSRYSHLTAGTLVVTVVGNTHSGKLTGVVADVPGSGTPDTVEISGTYLIAVDD